MAKIIYDEEIRYTWAWDIFHFSDGVGVKERKGFAPLVVSALLMRDFN